MSENKTAYSFGRAPQLSRRTFLRSAGVGTAAVTFGPKSAWAQAPSNQLNIALVGCGAQGQTLLKSMNDLLTQDKSIRLAAICDIWEYKRNEVGSKSNKQKWGEFNVYDNIDSLLSTEQQLDAVFLAVPDFLHAPYSIKTLEAGKPTYCEKMMSNTIEAARSMVEAQKRTGKLLQIGHQRRSNPRYIRLKDEVIGAKNPYGKSLLGQITNAQAQWNRAVTSPIKVNVRAAIPEDQLKAAGYENMMEFLNWRQFKKYGGGALSDLGAHQIDIFSWMFGTTPTTVAASGSISYFDGSQNADGSTRPKYEYPDNVVVIYEYNVGGKTIRVLYSVSTMTSSQGIFEKFMGSAASVAISEDYKNNQLYKENNESWDKDQVLGAKILDIAPGSNHHKFWESPRPWWTEDKWLSKEGQKVGAVDARASKPPEMYELNQVLNKLPHTPHIENFLDCVRNKKSQTDLNCPVQEAYKSCVSVLKAYEAIEKGTKITFDPAEFTV